MGDDLAREPAAVRGRLEAHRLRAHEHEDAGTVAPASGCVDGEPYASVLDLAGGAVGHRGLEPVHRPDELGHERRRRRVIDLRGGPDLLDPPLRRTATRSEIESASSWSWVT